MKSQILTLYKKEMMDLLRDKKTIIAMVLIPIFLYPTMMIISLFVMQGIVRESEEKEYKIAMVKSDVSEEVFAILTDEDDKFEYHFSKTDYDDVELAKAELSEKNADIVIVSKRVDTDLEVPGTDHLFEVVIYDLAANTNSANAYQYANEVLKNYSDTVRKEVLSKLYPDSDLLLNPISIKMESISTSEENAGSLVGTILPFILVISILAGAIYPAIDATAGERERGTLETIMTLPVRKSDIMISKFLSVSTISVFSALLNLLSMFGVVYYMYKTVSMQGMSFAGIDVSQFIPAILSLAICLPVFAMFTSAVSLCVCIFAKSFKEANNITSPIMVVFMFGAMVSILPNMKLSEKTALIPVSNIALLIKSVFSLDYDWHLVAIVLFSNLFYCVLMVVFMSTLFSSEDILFGESAKGVHIFEKRANLKKGQLPGYGDLCLLFAALILLVVYSGSIVTLKFGIYGSLFVQILIFAVPLLYAFYIRCDIKSLYSIKWPKIREALGSIVIWAGAFLVNQTLLMALSKIFPNMVQSSNDLNDMIISAGFLPAVIIVGICPAIAEEGAFRGFMFGTMKGRGKAVLAIIVSAAVFGLYHMNLLQFFTGLFMGCVMAYMVYRSGSIVTSMIFHMINNSLSVIATYYPEGFSKIPIIGEADPGAGSYALMALVGLALLAAGAFLFGMLPRKKAKQV